MLGIKLPAPGRINGTHHQMLLMYHQAPEFLKHYVYRNEITADPNTAKIRNKSLFATDGIGGLVRTLTGQSGLPTIDKINQRDEPGQNSMLLQCTLTRFENKCKQRKTCRKIAS